MSRNATGSLQRERGREGGREGNNSDLYILPIVLLSKLPPPNHNLKVS